MVEYSGSLRRGCTMVCEDEFTALLITALAAQESPAPYVSGLPLANAGSISLK